MIKKTIGLIVIATGILILLSNFEIISFENVSGLIFSLGVVIIGIVGMFEKKRFDLIMFTFVLVGGMYFLSNLGIIDKDIFDLLFLPIVIIAIGLSLLLNFNKKSFSNKSVTSYTAIFGGVEDKNISEEYVRSEIVAIFGGADVDYRKIKIKDKVGYIDVTTIFGGATIIVPEDVKVTVKGLPIFGGVENKAVANENAKKELIINYTSFFGGLDIKN
ncbi:MAG TPA: cell wall-active antibiotics response protein [Mollicutes bacterium]|nr:cell wall-active antibiotics response protein [Mollicutes bacterium]